ncbi:MAG: GNAT family N-acetyltransferase [Woeseia sp.]
MRLNVAAESDVDHLMTWFPSKRSVAIWGGPKFRYPFTPETFREDMHWRQIASYCLADAGTEVLAFGQIYERHGRINLARLVVSPDRRGEGLGKRLIMLLMEKGREIFSLGEFSLYVYADNRAAKACYLAMGFEERQYPDGDDIPANCIYMTRAI